MASKNGEHTQQTPCKHILPMVPIIIHSGYTNKGSSKERKKDNAKFCHMSPAIKYSYLSGQVQRQKPQTCKGPCNSIMLICHIYVLIETHSRISLLVIKQVYKNTSMTILCALVAAYIRTYIRHFGRLMQYLLIKI